MKTTIKKTAKTSIMYDMEDIVLDITWSKIAERYFPGKSVSWFYNKLRGVDGNGGEGGFTLSEKAHLKNSLFDFSERVRNVAQKIEL
jgi:hypothetical protein